MNFVSCPIAGPPSPPRTPSFVQQYGRDSVMLTVQWQSSQDGGGAPVNYTITVSPGLVTFTTTATSATVTIPYNVMHTVSIVATNCNGSSSVVMETIPAIGMACMCTTNHCDSLWDTYVWSVERGIFSLWPYWYTQLHA